MKDSYRSVKSVTHGLYKEKGSKFLSFAYPVSDTDEIEKILIQIRKKYYDARHHCYAYLLGSEGKIYRSNDDGEPRHTAGDPILNQIKSFHLSDILLVVIRYFGGTKLGKSGLINAYKIAAKDALDTAIITRKYLQKMFLVKFSYEGTSQIMRVLQNKDIDILEQNYDDFCSIKFLVRESMVMHVISELEKINSIKEIKSELPYS